MSPQFEEGHRAPFREPHVQTMTVSQCLLEWVNTRVAMAGLNADQRNDYFLQAAVRTGIHKPILAALFAAQQRPSLSDGEVGLGISPANRIPLEQVNTFAQQVQYAANTVRSITGKLLSQGWQAADLWDVNQGRYSDRFLEVIANGYVPSISEPDGARLEPTQEASLINAYLADWTLDCKTANLLGDFGFLESALPRFTADVPRHYLGLGYQRQALLETNRIWQQVDAISFVLAGFLGPEAAGGLDPVRLDQALLQATQQLPANYAGLPHQREALLRLVQLWQQCISREAAIAYLEATPTADPPIRLIDPALMAFIQRLPQTYQGKGDQRNALTETYRLWYNLDSRGAVLQELGVDSQALTSSNPNRNALMTVATQLDRSLLEFVRRIPSLYQEIDLQREALIRLAQLWQGFESRDQTLQALLHQTQQLETARRDSPDAAPRLEPLPLLPRPEQWTPDNLQLDAPIVEQGTLTWADATHGGKYLPTQQITVDAIVRIAKLAQQASDRIGRPFRVTCWYNPGSTSDGRSSNRHAIGDAIEFYCEGVTGNQVYQALDPWWAGGLGRSQRYPYLCSIDARGERVRWTET